MEYRFTSLFDRATGYVVDTEAPLDAYDSFSLSIRKVDKDDKSFGSDNIDCALRYWRKGTLEFNKIALDGSNFDGYHILVERFRKKDCLSMGEAIELAGGKPADGNDNVSVVDAPEGSRPAFEEFVRDSKVMDALYECFLSGVSHGRRTR